MTNNSVTKLKPCPFCGSNVTVLSPIDGNYDCLSCSDCGCQVVSHNVHSDWNTRPQQADVDWEQLHEIIKEDNNDYIASNICGLLKKNKSRWVNTRKDSND